MSNAAAAATPMSSPSKIRNKPGRFSARPSLSPSRMHRGRGELSMDSTVAGMDTMERSLAVEPEVNRIALSARTDSHQRQPEFPQNMYERSEERNTTERENENELGRHETLIARLRRRDGQQREHSLREPVQEDSQRKGAHVAMIRQLRAKLDKEAERRIDLKISRGEFNAVPEESGNPVESYSGKVIRSAPSGHKRRLKPQPSPRRNPRNKSKFLRRRPMFNRTPIIPNLLDGADLTAELPRLFPGLRGHQGGLRILLRPETSTTVDARDENGESNDYNPLSGGDGSIAEVAATAKRREIFGSVHRNIMMQLGDEMRRYKTELQHRLNNIMRVLESERSPRNQYSPTSTARGAARPSFLYSHIPPMTARF